MPELDELRATAHPVRLRLLSLLTGAALSAAEAGRELGLSQAAASYSSPSTDEPGRGGPLAVLAAAQSCRTRPRASW